MSDHLDAPDQKSPNMQANVDICDVYVFQKPDDANKSILVLNVNPIAPTFSDEFAPEAVYEIKIDNNGDAIADSAYRFIFSEKKQGKQTATVRYVSGTAARDSGDEGADLFQDVAVTFDKNITIVQSGEYRFFAGIRSDPFFFDLDGFKNGMQFTGTDTFLDKNVFSIVLELPNSAFGNNARIGIWARVLIPKYNVRFFQIDRMGRPFINVAFNKNEDKDVFNRIEPTQDREMFTQKFIDLFVAAGQNLEEAQQTAQNLLPDILTYDYSRPAGYPNGRTLTDDIIDIQLGVLTNGKVTTDKVEAHQDFLTTFPYLGTPHLSV